MAAGNDNPIQIWLSRNSGPCTGRGESSCRLRSYKVLIRPSGCVIGLNFRAALPRGHCHYAVILYAFYQIAPFLAPLDGSWLHRNEPVSLRNYACCRSLQPKC